MMKTVAELQERKIQALKAMNAYHEASGGYRILVGMATCGRAAGAEPVMQTLLDEVKKRNLTHVDVKETGCIGVCRFEPMFEVYDASGKRVTYVKMDEEKTLRVVTEHLVNKKPVLDYTIGAFNG